MWQHIEKQLNDQLPFVVYRKPKQSEISAVFQKDKILKEVIDFNESGFLFAPFESHSTPVLITKDAYLSSEFSGVAKALPTFENKIHQDSERDTYINLVRETIREIKSGKFRKVVLSRVFKTQNNDSPITLFKRILSFYKNAFCYLWYHPKVGMWLGATPEILLQFDKQVLTTMALAGTLKYNGVSEPKWSKKEFDEQALVTDYIMTALNANVTDMQQSKLETIRAGELLHLRTKITGILNSDNLRPIIEALHPTPAVCGFPKKETMDYILQNESYERQFYAGYLGELNFGSNKSTRLYVNLRCMQKIAEIMNIYVGGGVTKDSNPEKEWQETVNKSSTMLSVVHAENNWEE